MYAIRNYTNTKCELEMAKTRLNLLMDRKEKLYCKYFPITSKPKEIMVTGGEKNKNKMADYLYELHNVIDVGTGMSLAEEIECEQQNVDKLQSYIDKMDETLSKMSGIEYELFYEIVYNGTNITKAVEILAEKKDKEPQTIWKNHYRKIKKDIKTISKFSSKIQ